nr:hypothetical protein [uncultured Cetobacterium sp.]
MKKTAITLTTIILIIVAIIFAKDIYFKNIVQKELSKSLDQEVTLSYAHLGLISQDISLSDIKLKKDGINIKNINFDISIKDLLNNKKISIKHLNMDDITFSKKQTVSKIENNKKKSDVNTNVTKEFFKELTNNIAVEKNISNIFSGSFNIDKISGSLSDNLVNFLINNADYIDIILEKELNLSLENNLIKFKTNFSQTLLKLETLKEIPQEYSINIKNTTFNGTYLDFNFNGDIKDINNNFNSNAPINFEIIFTQKDSTGTIVGNANLNTLTANLAIKAPKIYLSSFTNLKNYINNGNMSLDYNFNINNSNLFVQGTSSLFNIDLNKDNIINSLNTTKLNKKITKEILVLGEENIKTFSATTKYSTEYNTIKLKTSLPEQLRSTLINNKNILNKEFTKTIEEHYDSVIEEKKKNITNIFENFKNIF